MASDRDFVEYVSGQMEGGGAVTYRKMFGEYAVYVDGKVVALVCDNQLFVKPTARGREFAGDVVEAPPYPGAKPYLLIDSGLEDRQWLSQLAGITASELPAPKPKRKGATRVSSQ